MSARLKKDRGPRLQNGGTDTVELGRKEQLMAAALDLFAERNFASVTIKDIAHATGVNTALIYYYFESKDDLFRAAIENAVDQAFENFRQLRARHESAADTIDGWLRNHVQLFEPIHKMVKVSLDYAGARNRIDSIDRSIRRFYDEEARLLSNCIRQGVADGQFRSVDADSLALFISTYLDGVMVRSVILPELDLEIAVEYLREQVWQTLGYNKGASASLSADG